MNHAYDVIILGSGLGGSMLGAILARHGRRVLMIDAAKHPRFAIGEATTPDTSIRLKLLALKYEVPEIAYLSQFYLLRDNISPSSGVKRAFSFLHHHEGEEHEPTRSHQFPTGAPPWGPDCHLFRQDTDAFMARTATRYGAQLLESTRVETIDIADDGVSVVTTNGQQYSASFLIDAAGFRSPLAQTLGLRGDPNELRTRSRAIFTHMVDVPAYDHVGQEQSRYGLVYPLCQTTLHHVFDGGWLWVIPFDNHRESTNNQCSVGLLLDERVHPHTGRDAQEEFFDIIGRFPAMARQLRGARANRPFVSTPRLQYWSPRTVGDRWLLLAHAAGFVDPLYSSGLNLTVGVLDSFADELLVALDDGRFEAQRFAHVDAFFQNNLRLYDRIVAHSYLAWRDYDLWDAWYRVWVAALQVGTYLNGTQLMRYQEAGDRAVLERSRQPPLNALLGTAIPECGRMVEQASAVMDRFGHDELSAASAAEKIREILRTVNFCPTYWRLADPEVRTTPPYTMTEMVRAYVWYHRHAPAHIRDAMVGFGPLTAARYTAHAIGKSRRQGGLRSHLLYLRDSLTAWNRDWQPR